MKPLLSKITKPFLMYVLFVLIISVPVYYWVVDTIWKAELDEHNKITAEKTAYELNRMNLTDQKLSESIKLWNDIQPGTNIQNIRNHDKLKDSIFTYEKQKPYTKEIDIDRFRALSTVIYVNNKPFRFTVQTNIEESQETIVVIAITTFFFFIAIVLGFLLINRKLSNSVWKPFRNTLDKLKSFNLNHQTKIEFNRTDILEFEELNSSLSKLIEHNVSVYKTQKEFTENASHELQTPLAILKNKLDILQQSKDLTEGQYQITEEMNNALTRSSRINKNLLLLAKIENNQFDNTETISFDALLHQSIDILQEHFEQKSITIQENIHEEVRVQGNSSLTEILINNLILNAIRHTPAGGLIFVKLTRSLFEISNSGTEKLNTDLLFKRFSTLSSHKGGSGLGLAIIKEICTFHGWKVNYRFENNQHIFSVSL
ncbi:histidine kinase [Elizabethkingia miricola]|uniref:histidine kinase n=1 Tax=Elizabethkingia miricola TaxID=172045 RepID=A0ABY3NH36_ELIMR|nr:HAMP domain-containing sensor histidine kinase [Elizabethkingia miricola]NHQ67899.1 HAMP domain-containing histidine kinase [Elizabethkingia miricola]NHQ71641.1 HAMP domain-containing histidine kinase [Elizabethkingia miricola]NHQ77423.1 HAMP domain-containing histidine kinase [Elizabethkingia miricola]OBS12603.1 histidine kinase [Elizabethkingia miricola]PSL89004.1 sensor histidine kinase [Elizabethkingia miricola]